MRSYEVEFDIVASLVCPHCSNDTFEVWVKAKDVTRFGLTFAQEPDIKLECRACASISALKSWIREDTILDISDMSYANFPMIYRMEQ